MKRILLLSVLLSIFAWTSAQRLSIGSADVINVDSYPEETFLVEAEGSHFYRVSGSYSSSGYHELLPGAFDPDYRSLYFLKYDSKGNPVSGNYMRGPYYPVYAGSFRGGMTVFTNSYNEVNANGTILTNGSQNRMEVLANYSADCQLVNIIRPWNEFQEVYPYSEAVMDPMDGSMYIFGTGNFPYSMADGLNLGDKLETPSSYFYVIKYDRNLERQWVYTAGFDAANSGTSPYYNDIRVFPGKKGELMVVGNYSSDATPLIGGSSLPRYASAEGYFAAKLDENGSPLWVLDGMLDQYAYASRIFNAIPMSNGDFVMVGNTHTGAFSLGEFSVGFPNGQDYNNQFAFRVDDRGGIVWQRAIASMGYVMEGKKKGTESEEFNKEVFYEAQSWREKILFLAGTFTSGQGFIIGDKKMETAYPVGIYLAALNLEDGSELWGYGLGSDDARIFGMDMDRCGNVSLMGQNYSNQEIIDVGVTKEGASNFIFHVGVDFAGRPLWYNNASFVNGPNYYNLSASDLVVLPNGELFTTLKFNEPNILDIGGEILDNTQSVYSSMVLNLKPGIELGGFVIDENENPVSSAWVRAIRTAPWGTYPQVDSVRTNAEGFYQFTNLYPGFYALLAVPDPVAYSNYMPTYFGGYINWKSAFFHDIPADFKANIINIPLALKPVFLPGDGKGEISGELTYEDDPAAGDSKSTMGQPVKKTAVILLRKSKKSTGEDGNFAAYVESDENGVFWFRNVPDGTYLLLVDVPGLPMLENHEATIEGEQLITNLNYTVSEDGIYTGTGVGSSFLENVELLVYPNPGNGLLIVDVVAPGEYLSEVYTLDGRQVMKEVFQSDGGALILNIQDEPAGMYILRLRGETGTHVIKYIKE